jgi:hypothetical protein
MYKNEGEKPKLNFFFDFSPYCLLKVQREEYPTAVGVPDRAFYQLDFSSRSTVQYR